MMDKLVSNWLRNEVFSVIAVLHVYSGLFDSMIVHLKSD